MIGEPTGSDTGRPSRYFGRVPDVSWSTSDGQTLLATIRVREEPLPGSGLPVILLHGLSQQRHFWDPVIARLRAPIVAALDQRGHGHSATGLDGDYRIPRCALDVIEFMDARGWERSVIVGHSWGASVALSAATSGRAAALALIDGGLWGPALMGERVTVRERLRPPALGIPEAHLRAMVEQSAPYLGAEGRAALAETFVVDDAGLVRTRIGVERHMRVLDGLLDYDPADDLARISELNCPTWAVVCEPADEGDGAQALGGGKWRAVSAAARIPGLLVHRWMGAVHDVPLQWPALVAGLIDALHAEVGAMQAGRRPE
jgi:pimeloyl-ACP methyl ester carboxylesterase